MSDPFTLEDSKALLALCRAGKLYDTERWIAAGKSIVTVPTIKRTPQLTAVDAGFHSLVELLARHEPRQEQKDKALAEAVDEKPLDWSRCSSSTAHGSNRSACAVLKRGPGG